MTVRNEQERAALRACGRILASVLATVAKSAHAGTTTLALDTIARREIAAAGAVPAFLGYQGFPAALCTSINDEVVHGIPSESVVLQEGDVVGLDLGVRYQGLYTDGAVTVVVGKNDAGRRLAAAAAKALETAVATVRAGITTGDLGAAIQASIEGDGFTVVQDLVGHGVGAKVHEDPPVPNYGKAGKGEVLTEGLVIAIEPMITNGGFRVVTKADGWTVATADGSLAAHFEHTVIVTKDGCEVMTKA